MPSTPEQQYTNNALSSLNKTIVDNAPYYGSLSLPVDTFKLFFQDQNDSAHVINPATATKEELDVLAVACSVASFGRGSETVTDESYRKAGNIDLPRFATPLEPEGTPLIAGIRETLLEGADAKRPIRFELYKLNVYGEGGFFKAHQDTPRSDHMFGSLVLVYPTVHAGGALVFRHQGREWTFDSAAAVSHTASDKPCLGYAAFFSDVEHEVLPVTSGYRVTLTYNLYYDDVTEPSANHPTGDTENAFQSELQRLLDDPLFMPNGGYLGFGLRHVYPLELTEEFYPKRRGLQHILRVLKGADGVVYRAALAFGLSTRLHLAYEEKDEWERNGDYNYADGDDRTAYNKFLILMTRPLPGSWMYDTGLFEELPQEFGAVVLYDERHRLYNPDRAVHWVTPYAASRTRLNQPVLVYGNNASLDHLYADLCMVVAIGKPGDRTAMDPLGKLPDMKGKYSWEEDTDEKGSEGSKQMESEDVGGGSDEDEGVETGEY
ncbi:hypothetical protein PENSPDRAFT_747083 [Peniophora sp. CONT]|nr:hypothetical protein PENSPDRAFT_747083 [Peniophora sp. CONT]